MRKQWCAVLVIAFQLRTSLVWAQSTSQGDAVGLPESTETHTVVRGDTLWDLTARYLNNPWYWPKVWSYNPQLTNPHFIYPGDIVRFFKGSEEAPARLEASAQRDMPPSEQTPGDNTSNGGTDVVSIAGNRTSLVYGGRKSTVVHNMQLITPKELQESGELVRAFEDKMMLTTHDTAYVRYSNKATRGAVGQKVIFYKKIDSVEHPVNGRRYGYLTLITGIGEIKESGDAKTLTTVQVIKAYDAIERGQLIAPFTTPFEFEIDEKPNTAKLEGVILRGQHNSKALLGQHHYVFIDRGSKDGLSTGNVFNVFRNKDTFEDFEGGDTIPNVNIGQLMVVDAKETASLALITRSLVDMRAGDRIATK